MVNGYQLRLFDARTCVLMPPESFVRRPVEWLRAITKHRATVSFAPNFAYDLCVRRVKDLGGLDLSSWRVAGCGAEHVRRQGTGVLGFSCSSNLTISKAIMFAEFNVSGYGLFEPASSVLPS